MPLATAPLAIAAGAALNGMGGGMANPYFSTLLVDKTPYAAHGRVIGLFVTTMFSGSFLNPFVIIPLKINFGIHNAFVIVGIMSLAIGIVSVMRSRLPWTTASATFVGSNDDGALPQRS
jgi:MFS family permease